MKSRRMLQLLSILLILCMIFPSGALAKEDGLWPVPARDALDADYQMQLVLDTEALPFDPEFHAADWAAFLEKLSLSGNIKCYNYPYPDNFFKHDGSLNLKGNPVLALNVDSMNTFRYIRSNAWKGDPILFQMHNFLEFSTKFSYYGFNAKYVALLMYPEATLYLANEYQNVLASCLYGNATRDISYQQLSKMCQELNQITLDEESSKHLSRYLKNLLSDMRVSNTALEQLGQMDAYLDFLDPEKMGMTITVENGKETYVIGGRTIMERTWDDLSSAFTLTLPDQNGCQLNVDYARSKTGTLDIAITTLSEDEITMDAQLSASGLPAEDQPNAEGTVHLSFGGKYIAQEPIVYDFQFTLNRSDVEYPHHTDLTLGWVHLATGKAALKMNLSADCALVDPSTLTPANESGLPDFFRLNEGVISEYVSLYGKSAIATLLPLAMEIPSGVINDLVTIVQKYDVLETLGIF